MAVKTQFQIEFKTDFSETDCFVYWEKVFLNIGLKIY